MNNKRWLGSNTPTVLVSWSTAWVSSRSSCWQKRTRIQWTAGRTYELTKKKAERTDRVRGFLLFLIPFCTSLHLSKRGGRSQHNVKKWLKKEKEANLGSQFSSIRHVRQLVLRRLLKRRSGFDRDVLHADDSNTFVQRKGKGVRRWMEGHCKDASNTHSLRMIC